MTRNRRAAAPPHGRRGVGLALGLALLVGACLGLAAPAFAEPGVTLGIGKITFNEPLAAGAERPLPGLPVTNSGTSAASYRVVVTSVSGQPEQAPDPSWFAVRPAAFELRPGEQREVEVALRLPWLVAPGAYAGLIQVGPAAEPGAGGTGLAVAAAARVAFTVEHGNVVSAVGYETADALQKRAPWSYVLLVGAVLVVGYPIVGRLFGIRIAVERRRA